jgi:hypothetical protein
MDSKVTEDGQKDEGCERGSRLVRRRRKGEVERNSGVDREWIDN